jgi:hypothetical protein
LGRDFRGQGDRQRPGRRPEEIWALVHDPRLRWGDLPGGDVLAQHAMLNPDDPHLAELLELTLRDQAARGIVSGDPFHGNYPPVGKLPLLVPGRIPLVAVPTGEVLSVGVPNVLKNVLVVGPTGGGKTNWLRLMIGALL